MSNYSKRDVKVYNKFRTIFQWIVCNIFLGAYVNLMYDYKVEGKENVVKGERFIVAANHISGIDPFLVAYAIGVPVAFMAKIELFENFFSRLIMDYCGAFAVRRDKVEVSTIKTALNIKNTKWMLGLFPQGTRDSSSRVEKISKGFATFAKSTKSGILPVAIIGSDTKPKFPFSNKLTVKIGKIIPYSEDIESMMQQWCESISSMTGKEYVLEQAVEKED